MEASHKPSITPYTHLAAVQALDLQSRHLIAYILSSPGSLSDLASQANGSIVDLVARILAPEVRAALAQSGGPYTLTWSSIDGGGLTQPSTGGPYTVAGTIGQPDAGPLELGPPFTFAGGFWNQTVAPACRADFNGSGAVSVQDIFDFLAAYFSSDPRADFNNSGGVSVQDIFDYLAAYFAGCT